jgi:hypothetical protein
MSSKSPDVGDAFRTALDLFAAGIDLMRQNLRRRYPDAGDEELGELLRVWLRDRPGAQFGDGYGRPVDVNSRFP